MKSCTILVTVVLLTASSRAQTPAGPATPSPISTPAPASAQKPTATAPATPATPAGPESTPTAKHVRLKYSPPKTAATGTRVDGDGGSRGERGKLPSLYVLAPNHTGLTTREQPSLFWYQSAPAPTRFELTLIEPKKPKPLLKVGVEKAEQPGIHRLPLSKYNITLAPGVTYKWTIAFVPDAANHSQDLIASGTIQRIQPDAQLTAALAGAQGVDKAAVYASKGCWYDALEIVTDEINAAPANKEMRLQRATLLDQAGLKDAAASDRK